MFNKSVILCWATCSTNCSPYGFQRDKVSYLEPN